MMTLRVSLPTWYESHQILAPDHAINMEPGWKLRILKKKAKKFWHCLAAEVSHTLLSFFQYVSRIIRTYFYSLFLEHASLIFVLFVNFLYFRDCTKIWVSWRVLSPFGNGKRVLPRRKQVYFYSLDPLDYSDIGLWCIYYIYCFIFSPNP